MFLVIINDKLFHEGLTGATNNHLNSLITAMEKNFIIHTDGRDVVCKCVCG